MKLSRTQLARATGAAYFLLLSAINFFASWTNGFFRWTDCIFFLLCLAAVFITRKVVSMIFGGINLLIWGLLMLAISDDLLDYCSGIDHYSRPWEYFGVGYALMITGIIMSLLILVPSLPDMEPPSRAPKDAHNQASISLDSFDAGITDCSKLSFS